MSENEDKDIKDADDLSSQPVAESKPAPKKKPTRDRNQRVRELAQRKLEESKQSGAGKSARGRATGLDAGEMFDDAVARGFSAFTKWALANRRGIEIGVAVAILGGIGYATWDWYSTKREAAASAALYQAVESEQGIVKPAGSADEPAGNPDDEEARFDTRPKFPSYEARSNAVISEYRTAADKYGSLGAGMLARLGEAGAMLGNHEYDGALKAANAVLGSELAKADVDVRNTAREIVGMSLEGKGDIDGAKKAYDEMAASDTAEYKELGEYHSARMLLAKGDKEAAKDKLTKLRDKLSGATATDPVPPSDYLREQVDLMLRTIDPSLGSAKGASPGSQLTPEQLQRLQEEIQRLSGGNAPAMPGMPNLPAPAMPPAPAPAPSGNAP